MSQDNEKKSSDNSSTIKNLFRQPGVSEDQEQSSAGADASGKSGQVNDKKAGGFFGKLRSVIDSMKQNPEAEDESDEDESGQNVPKKKRSLIQMFKIESYEDDTSAEPEKEQSKQDKPKEPEKQEKPEILKEPEKEQVKQENPKEADRRSMRRDKHGKKDRSHDEQAAAKPAVEKKEPPKAVRTEPVPEPEDDVRIYVRKNKQGIREQRPSRPVPEYRRKPHVQDTVKEPEADNTQGLIYSAPKTDDIYSDSDTAKGSGRSKTQETAEKDIFSVSDMTKESGPKKTQNPADDIIPDEPEQDNVIFNGEEIERVSENIIYTSVKKSSPPPAPKEPPPKPVNERSKRELPAFDIFEEFAREQKEQKKKSVQDNKPENKVPAEQTKADETKPEAKAEAEAKAEVKAEAESEERADIGAKEKAENIPETETPVSVTPVPEKISAEEKSAADEVAEAAEEDSRFSADDLPGGGGIKIIPWEMTKKLQNAPNNIIYDAGYDEEPEPAPRKEKDLSEGYVTSVTYHYSEAEPIVVMAGKFSRTLRIEYESARVFRLTGSPVPSAKKPAQKQPEKIPVPPPVKPVDKKAENQPERKQQTPERKQQTPPAKAPAVAVVPNELPSKSLFRSPKNSEAQKQPAEPVVVVRAKPEKEETPRPQTERKAAPEPPKMSPPPKPAEPPKMPPPKPAEPQVLDDLMKNENRVEEIKPPKKEKVKKAVLKSEKHKAVKNAKSEKEKKKKIRIGYLFNTEEDYDPDDDIHRVSETKPQLDDYNEESDAEAISTEISTNFQSVFARTIVLLAATVASLVLALLGQCTTLFSETIRNGWLWFALIGFVFFVIAAFASRSPILNGLSPLKHFKGNSDTAVAVASVAAAMQSITAIFTPDVYINGKLHLYTALVTLALLCNSVGKLLIITRTHYNFAFLTKPYPKYAGKIFTDKVNAEKMTAELPAHRPIIGYTKRSKFMSNFLQLSYAPDPSEDLAARIAPWTALFSVVCGIVYGVLNMSFIGGLSSFALTAFMSVPLISLLVVNLPLRRLCKSVLKGGAMITSYETVKQFSDTNAIMVDSSQLYPKGSVTLSGMKSFKQSKLNEALLSGAAIMYAVNGTMIHVFENIVQCSKDLLPKVDNVIYEDGRGLVGWVNNQRVLIGNRALLESHNIEPPEKGIEEKYYAMGNDITYISVSGELIAMFILSYKTNKNVAIQLKKLEEDGVSFVVRTVDANLTKEMVAKNFGLFHRCISILPTNLGNICHEATTSVDERSRAYLVTRGKLSSFARAVSGCIRIKTNVTISVILQCVALAIGLGIVTLISFVSGFEKLGCFEMLIYTAFWTITIMIASLIRK